MKKIEISSTNLHRALSRGGGPRYFLDEEGRIPLDTNFNNWLGEMRCAYGITVWEDSPPSQPNQTIDGWEYKLVPV